MVNLTTEELLDSLAVARDVIENHKQGEQSPAPIGTITKLKLAVSAYDRKKRRSADTITKKRGKKLSQAMKSLKQSLGVVNAAVVVYGKYEGLSYDRELIYADPNEHIRAL